MQTVSVQLLFFRQKEQAPLYSFSTVTKLPSNVKVGQTDSSLPGSAARQHYLSQSRYLPGETARPEAMWVSFVVGKRFPSAIRTMPVFLKEYSTIFKLKVLVQYISRSRLGRVREAAQSLCMKAGLYIAPGG